LATNVKACLGCLEWSESELSRRSGVSQKQVNNIVRERNGCGVEALALLGRASRRTVLAAAHADPGAGGGRWSDHRRRIVSERDLRILQAIERSSMVSTWKEYLCLEIRDGRALLSHRRYEALGEVSDFAVEAAEGDEEYRIPDVIDGKRVEGTEDEFIVGGELMLDPSDSEPELELNNADPDKVCAWLNERSFHLISDSEAAWAGTALEGRLPEVRGGDELEESDNGASPVEPSAIAQIAAVTHLRIRLKRWMDFPASDENDYPAEVIKKSDSFYYRARGVTVPIRADEALQVISNPFLYYFSTALKLHKKIDKEKGQSGTARQVRDQS
jgi:hypothetical protein